MGNLTYGAQDGGGSPPSRDLPLVVDVFIDPVVQLAALCPICALAALKPEAALSAVSPGLAIFNPAINPSAAALAFSMRLRSAGLMQRSLNLVTAHAISARFTGLLLRLAMARTFAGRRI